MTDRADLDNISIVLHQPRSPENIGAAARAMRNMGLSRLVVVDPENFDIFRVLKMSTHGASDIVKRIDVYDDLREALSSYNYVAGTSARLGKQRKFISPPRLARNLISISRENRVAVLFGPEDRGLSNEDIHYCHALVHIPTAEFSSLNLAQAVMILCYEIFTADQEEKKEFAPRLASRHELDGMYDQLKELLVRISYINPENPDYWMNHMRQFFTRLQFRAKEVSIIRGICRQVNWYGKKCYEDGLQEREEDVIRDR
ncbi:RNA methyltransferase [Desulfococcaceae bacterium HSG8]|nr:RNA methyltransferase [Desulfococcaceae bacterium HSG8]